eukprot:4917286-Prymnesium_polylepis.1
MGPPTRALGTVDESCDPVRLLRTLSQAALDRRLLATCALAHRCGRLHHMGAHQRSAAAILRSA